MTRRTLEEGLAGGLTKDEEVQSFVRGDRPKDEPQSAEFPQSGRGKQYRQPYTVKLRTEVVEIVHRISVFSDFRGQKLTKQAIVEEAIEQWVEAHRHLAEPPKDL